MKLSIVDKIVVIDIVIPRRLKTNKRDKETKRIREKIKNTDCLFAPVLLPERLENGVKNNRSFAPSASIYTVCCAMDLSKGSSSNSPCARARLKDFTSSA